MIIIRNTLGTGTSFAQSANYPYTPMRRLFSFLFPYLRITRRIKWVCLCFPARLFFVDLEEKKRRPPKIKCALLFSALQREHHQVRIRTGCWGGGGGGELRARSLALFPTYTVNCVADVLIIAVHATVLCDWVGFPASAGFRVLRRAAVQQCLRSAADLCWMNYWLI